MKKAGKGKGKPGLHLKGDHHGGAERYGSKLTHGGKKMGKKR
jgi:hypothetical protein